MFTVLHTNQKLGLLCSVLEHGNLELAKPLFERLPEIYPFGVSRRIAMAVSNIIGYKIEPFYREKYSHYRDNSSFRMKESWERFTCLPQITKDWNSLFNDACTIAFQLGPYIGARHEVSIKLIRLLNLFYDDVEAQSLPERENFLNIIVDLCDSVLVPAASLLDSNFVYCEELWQILGRLPYQERYRIYHRWRTIHTQRCWELSLQRGKVLGMTRYIMKRLSKDTAKVMGRQLGKLCHSYPTIPLDYLLGKVQEFQNFIGPVVDSIRFLSSLEFDVLAYCLIENLAAPEKQDFKVLDISYSPWLQSLASFSAAIFKRYNIDLGGILQYITNQLKDAKNLDLIVLREIVTSISGIESASDLTQEHLDSLCGGDILRSEASSLQMNKLNRRSINRLRDALLKDGLFESLCILIGQQRQFIVFRDSAEYPLKLATQMLDQCQETFVQFFHFLRTNLKPEQYSKRLPSALELLTDYHLSVDAMFCLMRPVYMNEIGTSYESAKQKYKEEHEDITSLDNAQKSLIYREIFINRLDTLSEELAKAFPQTMWQDITYRLHTIFWLLSVNDLIVPEAAYERNIEKIHKELKELHQVSSDSGLLGIRGGAATLRRTAKEEERLKSLELKLNEEKKRQLEHKARILDILSDEDIKKNFFAKSLPNKSSQTLRFLQSCIFPRVICSEVDAVYCAELVRALHITKTNDFQTIVLFDKIFTDVSPILGGFSERETVCFGRFCCILLELILHWHSSKNVFQEECEGFPGCVTKIRKKDMDDKAAADAFTYEFYRSICYKWMIRLTKSLSFMLQQTNYILIRNSLTFMLMILPTYPLLTQLDANIQKNVAACRDREKTNRQDLNLLCTSFLINLKKRNEGFKNGGSRRLYEINEFCSVKATKSSSSTNGTTRKQPVTAHNSEVKEELRDESANSSPTPPTSSKRDTSQPTPAKRSRPLIRSKLKFSNFLITQCDCVLIFTSIF
ncbi:unnamed protein product [Meloidogyne enterolobii]|uniref:Uncharacterized protein n=1 Tax=Meloidogyne enterolobii TaxID=390850 RepID=A0ACB0XRA0_MELEN